MSDKEPQQWMRAAATEILSAYFAEVYSGDIDEAVRIIAAHCPEKELGHGTERSDKDYAIEHAEYLAKAAESFLRVSNERAKAADEADSAEDLMNADESLNDHWRALECAIYEFRKRAKRAEVKSGKYPIARPSPDLDADETWQGIEKVYENASGGAPAGWEQNPQSEASSGAEDTRPPLRNEPLAAVPKSGKYPIAQPSEALPDKCPTCESPHPELHPSMQPDGGEVQICRNSWHSSVATQKESK